MNPEDLMRKYKYGYVSSKGLLERQFVKDLLKENKQLKENIDKLELENKVLKEQMVAMVKPNYIYGVRGSNE